VPPLEDPAFPYGSRTSLSQSAYPLDAACCLAPLEQVPLQSTHAVLAEAVTAVLVGGAGEGARDATGSVRRASYTCKTGDTAKIAGGAAAARR
jgi:hypothetical protein